ncbi:hypothetical protein GQ53DRAFT_379870 [Thozetella sp. PMI_491]|nr:hypothetical protein GQ53DRAFT_379870 [Thozetella sp. PMI_491]
MAASALDLLPASLWTALSSFTHSYEKAPALTLTGSSACQGNPGTPVFTVGKLLLEAVSKLGWKVPVLSRPYTANQVLTVLGSP